MRRISRPDLTGGRRPDPARRRTGRGRGFDLRATALLFGVLATVVVLFGLAGRVVIGAVERQPALAAALCLVGVSAAVLFRRGRRRFSAGRAARRAVAALDEGAATAVRTLESAAATPVAAPALPVPVPAEEPFPTADEPTVPLPDPELPGLPEFPEFPEATAEPAYEPAESDTESDTECAYDSDYDSGYAGDYDLMDGDEFEQAVAALCERDGCTDVEVVGGAGDLGADVLATAPDGRRVVIQCKRYCDTNKVGSQDLQRFGGTCFTVHEAQVAALVTTSEFTAPATEYAEQCGITCFDREALLAWSDGTGPEPWTAADTAPDPGTCDPCVNTE
ncbi:restriction endonuclease [Streptomyces sp. NPDC059785]|uniref:restriction endonuclease n=1 Tax=unclassified Streptomyces TaxID=2593676 RepID=UPI0036662652